MTFVTSLMNSWLFYMHDGMGTLHAITGCSENPLCSHVEVVTLIVQNKC